MGWDRGRYYTRSKKVRGRVVREYIGTGPVAQLAARVDALNRQERLQKALALRRAKAELNALLADVRALDEFADLVARAALVAAGYHQHNRGEWRCKRGK
jgi:hypothetical protein